MLLESESSTYSDTHPIILPLVLLTCPSDALLVLDGASPSPLVNLRHDSGIVLSIFCQGWLVIGLQYKIRVNWKMLKNSKDQCGMSKLVTSG